MKHRLHLLVLTLSLMTAVSVQAPKDLSPAQERAYEGREHRRRLISPINKTNRAVEKEKKRLAAIIDKSGWSSCDFEFVHNLGVARFNEYTKMEEALSGDDSYESFLDLVLCKILVKNYLMQLAKEEGLARSSFEREKRARFDKILEQVQRINLLILCYRGTSKEVHRAMVERARKKLEHMIFSDEVLSDSYTVSA